jgi:hypothetical protein
MAQSTVLPGITALRGDTQLTCDLSANPQVFAAAPAGTNVSRTRMRCVDLDPTVFQVTTVGGRSVLKFIAQPSVVISPRLAYHVVPAGTLDGANATFTLPDAPNPAISLVLSRNGLTLFPGVDYNLVGATITFLTGPAGSAVPNPGDILQAVSYQF